MRDFKQSIQVYQNMHSRHNSRHNSRSSSKREYMNVTETWKNGEGRRNTVVIRNGGPAVKRVDIIHANGKKSTKTRKLTGAEKKKILSGTFIPGLWRNCCPTTK